jgi:hypothetical protein
LSWPPDFVANLQTYRTLKYGGGKPSDGVARLEYMRDKLGFRPSNANLVMSLSEASCGAIVPVSWLNVFATSVGSVSAGISCLSALMACTRLETLSLSIVVDDKPDSFDSGPLSGDRVPSCLTELCISASHAGFAPALPKTFERHLEELLRQLLTRTRLKRLCLDLVKFKDECHFIKTPIASPCFAATLVSLNMRGARDVAELRALASCRVLEELRMTSAGPMHATKEMLAHSWPALQSLDFVCWTAHCDLSVIPFDRFKRMSNIDVRSWRLSKLKARGLDCASLVEAFKCPCCKDLSSTNDLAQLFVSAMSRLKRLIVRHCEDNWDWCTICKRDRLLAR